MMSLSGIGDFPGDTDLGHRHLDREIALANGGEHRQQLIGIKRVGGGESNTAAAPTLMRLRGRATIAGRLFSRHENSRGASFF